MDRGGQAPRPAKHINTPKWLWWAWPAISGPYQTRLKARSQPWVGGGYNELLPFPFPVLSVLLFLI
jgi:hypothetical protein